jgi:hypothetical protein
MNSIAVLNIAAGTGISLNHLVNLLNDIFGSHEEPAYQSERLGAQTFRANTDVDKKETGEIRG